MIKWIKKLFLKQEEKPKRRTRKAKKEGEQTRSRKKRVDITADTAASVNLLRQTSRLKQYEIAKILDISPASVSAILKDNKDKGLFNEG